MSSLSIGLAPLQTQAQTLRLSPQMRQSLHVLSLSDDDLLDDIAQKLSANPALSLPPPPAVPAPAPRRNRPPPPSRLVAPEILQQWIDYRTASLTDTPSLYSHLEPQIIREALDEPLKQAALYLAGSIDPATLRPESPLPVIAAESSIPLPLLEEAWDIIQELDLAPPESPLEATANRLLPEVRFLPLPSAPSAFTAELLSTPATALALDPSFVPADAEQKRLLRDARAYLSALSARNRTLLNIALHIAKTQAPCLLRGFEHLAPASMTALAADLSLSTSTVSRAIVGKAAVLPSGQTVDLRTFFSPPVAPGSPVSARALRLLVRRIVQSEPPDAPLSDAAIAARLATLTPPIHIQRRTIAKIRAALHLPPAPHRHP